MTDTTSQDSAEAKSLRFIKDTPAEEDSFGTHLRIAKSVASVIQTHDDLKVIGLVGPWGSGKSTVITLIEKCLQDDKTAVTRFFIYNAWLHQSDPPRRSFLESLVTFFDLTKDARWQQRLDELNGQIDDADTTTTPTLTSAGKWILLSLFALPIGFEFVGHDWFNVWIPIPWLGFSFGLFWFGLFLLMLPALIAGFVYLKWRPVKNPFAAGYTFWHWKKNWLTHKHPHERESILTLFMSKAVTRVNHRTTRSPDPTTIEFQRIFRDIISAVSSPGKRFIFVVDNLDRLPEDAAVELWATIRSFFLGALEPGAARANSQLPTILLPIDPDAVTRMYAATYKDEAPRLAQAFMDKTFDLTFRVPPPVFSGWKKYLDKQMRWVFSDECTTSWVYSTGVLYEKFLSVAENGEVTPRQINGLINSIAVLWLQWKNEIPFPTLAYFSINKSAIESNFGTFIRQEHPEIARFDQNWAAGIAAIHFGVPVEDALQVHLEAPLTKAISSGDMKAFEQHAKTPGFDHVFEVVLEKSGSEPEFISNASRLLGTLNPPITDWVSSSWHTLIVRFSSALPWSTLTQEYVSGLSYLLRNCSGSDLKISAPALALRVPQIELSVLKDKKVLATWSALITAMFDGAAERNCAVPNVVFPGDVTTYLDLLPMLSSRLDLLKRINFETDGKIIVDALGTDFTNAREPQALGTKFDALFALDSKRDWSGLLQACADVLRGTSGALPQAAASLRTLGKLRAAGGSGSASQLSSLSNEGFLFEKLAQAHAAKAIEAEATTLALLLLVNPTFQNPNNEARAQAGLAFANTLNTAFTELSGIVELLSSRLNESESGNLLSLLVAAIEANGVLRPLLTAVCTLRVDQKKQGPLNIVDILARLPLYLGCIDAAKHSAFVVDLVRYPKFWETLKAATFDDNVRSVFRLLLASPDGKIVTRAQGELVLRMKSVAVDGWDSAIRSGSEPIDIARQLRTLMPDVEFGDTLYDALNKTQSEIQNSSDQGFLNRWFELSGFLNSNEHATEMRTLRDLLLREDANASRLPVLKTGGSDFLRAGHFDEEADRAVRYLVLPLLAVPDAEPWLSDNVDSIKRWLEKAPETTKGMTQQRIAAIWSDGDDGTKRRMSTLGDSLDFKSMPWDTPKKQESTAAGIADGPTADSVAQD